MSDEEKVLSDLKDIVEYFMRLYREEEDHHIYDQHYDRMVVVSNACNLIEELLKAQEPRVLTLEEVMQYIGYSEKISPKEWEKLPLWTESRDGTGVISGYRNVENLRNLINMSGLDGNYIAYKHWRCWSAKPTDEQREATPWME